MYPRSSQGSWLDALGDEDVAFLKRFVLASGSLKDLAAAYGVTYPTIRLRLDRLVERIQVLDQMRVTSPFERAMVALYANGKMDVSTLKAILVAHEREMQASQQAEGNTELKPPG